MDTGVFVTKTSYLTSRGGQIIRLCFVLGLPTRTATSFAAFRSFFFCICVLAKNPDRPHQNTPPAVCVCVYVVTFNHLFIFVGRGTRLVPRKIG